MRTENYKTSLILLLCMAGFYRMSENALQSSYGPFGRSLLGINAPEIGLASTLAGIITILANIVLVIRGGKHHQNRSLALGIVSITIANLLLVTSHSLATYLASNLFLGLASGLVMPGLTTLAGRLKGIGQERALTAFTVALTGSLALGPLIESFTLKVEHNSLRLGVLVFLPFVIIAMVTLGIISNQSHESSSADAPQHKTGKPPTSRALRIAIRAQLINQMPFVTVIVFGVLIGHSLYQSTTATSQLAFTVFFGVALVVRATLVWRSKRIDVRLWIVIGTVPMVLGLTIMSMGRTVAVFFLAMIILGIGHGLMFPLAISLVAKETLPENVARANAALFTATSAATATAPIFVGVLWKFMGYRPTLLAVAIIVLALGASNLTLVTHRANDDPAIR